jgi:CRP-like cAMP-binding protein
MVEPDDLKTFEIFRSFTDDQLKQLANITSKKTFRANALVYKQGEKAREVFVVSRGLISLRGVRSEDELVVAFEVRERGDLFGASSFMKRQLYTSTALCLEETEVFAIDTGKLLDRCESDAQLGYQFMRTIAELYFDRYETAKTELGMPVAVDSK